SGDHDFAHQWATQHNDTAAFMPAHERQLAVLAFPALASFHPAGLAEKAADVALDVLRELELEQIGLPALFQCGHQRVIAETAVATNQCRLALFWQVVEDL